MDIIVTRSRIAGTLPFYEYRALVLADSVDQARRSQVATIVSPRVAGRTACVRIAQVIAPARYFDLPHCSRVDIAARVGLLAKLIETLLVQDVFPEMTADLLPVVFQLDHDPGDACTWASIDDLTAAFDRLEPAWAQLTASSLGLPQDHHLRAA
ncbi:hypothetical protein AWL63_18160 [Sphingomonas panacis]|uniref:Uncharacterized protein n=1 Tax=Sphingomonas panacis TaxID=1560345 RepID=A0A1B3ZDR0_9SPHN|nr:hypothetical protein [Sphingomonas panacis]AOH85571.1 hypothetical protein AWL63_18160 [Sphingomonas panacis]